MLGREWLALHGRPIVEGDPINDMEFPETPNTSRRARDAGLARVMASHRDWMTAALYAARSVPEGWTGMGEDLRVALASHGLRDPDHHNAWGALIRAMIGYGILVDTGDIGQMRKVSSHARQSTIYRKVK